MARWGFHAPGRAGGAWRRGGTAACAPEVETRRCEARSPFNHGVALGDPRHDRLIIWTRVSPEQDGPVPVRF